MGAGTPIVMSTSQASFMEGRIRVVCMKEIILVSGCERVLLLVPSGETVILLDPCSETQILFVSGGIVGQCNIALSLGWEESITACFRL